MQKTSFFSNLIFALRKRLGWCPEPPTSKAAILMQPVRGSRFNLTRNSIFALVYFALSFSVVIRGINGIQNIIGGENVLFGFSNLLSILLLLLLGYLCIRWLRPTRFHVDLKTMIPLTFGLYALSVLSTRVNNVSLNVYDWIYDPYGVYWSPFRIVFIVSMLCSLAIFSFSLLKLSSIMLDGRDLDSKNLRIAIICLASYGLSGVFWIGYNWPISASSLFGPKGAFGTLMEHVTFLILSVDVLLERRLRRRSVYLTLFSVGIAWFLKWSFSLSSSLLLNPPSKLSSVMPFYDILDFALRVAKIPLIIASLLAIVVSYFLIREGKFERKTLALSLVAIFLYSSSFLLLDLFSVLFYCLRITEVPDLIFSTSGSFLIENLIHISHTLSVLTIGLLLIGRLGPKRLHSLPNGEELKAI